MNTTVTVGDGKQAKFWESSWIEGRARGDLAPNLYKLAWRKNNTVAVDLLRACSLPWDSIRPE
jgi:hypothetical protein